MQGTTDQETQSIGQYLIKLRQERGFSLVNISQYTRINISVLEKLEHDDILHLPKKTYLKGFVKAYVKAINGNEAYALELLDKTYASLSNDTRDQNTTRPGIVEKPSIQLAPMLFVIISSFLIITIGGYLTYYRMTKETKDKAVSEEKSNRQSSPFELTESKQLNEGQLIATPAESPQLVVETTPMPTPNVTATATATPSPSPQPSPTPKRVEVVATATPKPLPSPIPIKYSPKPIATGVVSEVSSSELLTQDLSKSVDGKLVQFTINTNNKYSYKANPANLDLLLPIPFQKAMLPKKQNIYIFAENGDSWITYKKDSEPVKKFTLKKGRYVFIVGDDIRLYVSNLQSSHVFFNNRLIDVGTSTSVKSFVFPESNWSRYHLPLFLYLKSGGVVTSDEFLKSSPR